MNLAYIGFGKMGRAVEEAARERGHATGAVIDNPADWQDHADELRRCDLAVEFSTPATAAENIIRCLDLGIPVVSGTTGWHDRLDEVVSLCRQRQGALFVASNFSIGMNIMFELNRRLAELMKDRADYRPSISETHHVHKLDAPSGTAIVLANDIAAISGSTPPIESHRVGEVPGIHEVVYDSAVDTITLRHEAKSRKGLALGAVLAAEFLVGRKGFFTMYDLLNDSSRA